MQIEELQSRLESGEVVRLSGTGATEALAGFELVHEEDTRLAGPIRILRAGNLVAVAERPEPGELVFRRMEHQAAAEAFIKDRLETYERMWDGCGCRIDYDH